MNGSTEADPWLSAHEAMRTYARTIGLSEDFLSDVVPREPGVMWLSDVSVMVHGTSIGLAVDRKEFEVVLQQIIGRLGVGARGDA